MCEKYGEIDKTIERYRRIRERILDQEFVDRAAELSWRRTKPPCTPKSEAASVGGQPPADTPTVFTQQNLVARSDRRSPKVESRRRTADVGSYISNLLQS
jgi:hypothetical protein